MGWPFKRPSRIILSGTIAGMDTAELTSRLAGLPIPSVRYFSTIGSTNDEALNWISAGAADGCLVVSDEQTSGRGRLNRKWITLPGAALAVSLVIRPDAAEMEHLPLFSPLAAVALRQVLAGLGLPVEVKWPNDVLVGRKKISGILTEAAWDGDRLQGMVIGVGVNIGASALPPADQLLFPATSVEQELGRPMDRFNLLRDFLSALFDWREKLLTPQFFHEWERHLAFLQEPVRIESAGQAVYNGVVLGVDPAGNLRLQLPSGEEVHIAVGDVRLRPA